MEKKIKEELLGCMLENNNRGMYIVKIIKDADGNPLDWEYVYCNEAAARLGNTEKEKLIGQRFRNVCPEGNDKWLKIYYAAACEGQELEFDEFSEEIGSYIHLNITPSGKDGYCCCYVDDTKKELFRLLDGDGTNDIINAEQRRSALLSALCVSYDVVYLCDLKKDTFEIIKQSPYSHTFKKSHEVPDENKKSYSSYFRWFYENIVTKDSTPDYWETLKPDSLMETLHHQDSIEIRHRGVKNGAGQEYYIVQAIRLFYNEESFMVVVGILTNDEQVKIEQEKEKKLKEALQAAKQHSEVIEAISSIYGSMYQVDIASDRCWEISGGGIHRFTGKSGRFTETIQRATGRFLVEEDWERMRTFCDLTTLPDRLKNDSTVALEYRANGDHWHMARFIAKKRDEAGTVEQVLFVINVIDERKQKELTYQQTIKDGYRQLEEQKIALEKAVKEANQANEAKTNFLHRMSHDIRTPINAIYGMLEIAEHYKDDAEKQTECRKKTKEAAGLLLELVNEVLDMGRLESGKITLENIPFSLDNIAEKVFSVMTKVAEERGIKIICSGKYVTHWNVLGSPTHVKRILMNVMSNAVKYNKNGGSVNMVCKELPSEDKNVALIQLSCEDTGIGMSKEFLEHIFDPFSQEDVGELGNITRTGLGMTITKNLVEMMHGKITIESEKNVGTKVVITIPFQIDSSRHMQGDVAEENMKSIKDMHILVAEDNDMNMEIAEFILKNEGAFVTKAFNGQEAVDLFAQSKPYAFDVLLMDIMMPGLNGYEATKKIRAMDRADAKSVPIIAMTANAFTDDRIKTKESGMNAHISKPINVKLLIDMISKMKRL